MTEYVWEISICRVTVNPFINKIGMIVIAIAVVVPVGDLLYIHGPYNFPADGKIPHLFRFPFGTTITISTSDKKWGAMREVWLTLLAL
ncbi:MAG: hypothetical protein QXU18_11315 [Thermoplasmatales archaeon]